MTTWCKNCGRPIQPSPFEPDAWVHIRNGRPQNAAHARHSQPDCELLVGGIAGRDGLCVGVSDTCGKPPAAGVRAQGAIWVGGDRGNDAAGDR
jgi:hypothetical protein